MRDVTVARALLGGVGTQLACANVADRHGKCRELAILNWLGGSLAARIHSVGVPRLSFVPFRAAVVSV